MACVGMNRRSKVGIHYSTLCFISTVENCGCVTNKNFLRMSANSFSVQALSQGASALSHPPGTFSCFSVSDVTGVDVNEEMLAAEKLASSIG